MTYLSFDIRDLPLAMVVELAVGWMKHRKFRTWQTWWADHVKQHHSGNINENNRRMAREKTP